MTSYTDAATERSITKSIDIPLKKMFEYCEQEVTMMALGAYTVGAVSRALLNPSLYNAFAVEGCTMLAAAGAVLVGWGIARLYTQDRIFNLKIIYG